MNGRVYMGLVSLLFAALVLIAFLQTLGDDGTKTLGLDRLEPRWALPEFAVPSATGSLNRDANVAQDDCVSDRLPCPADDRRDAACQIDSRGAIRVCDLFSRPLVLSFWFTMGDDCVSQQDALEDVHRRYRGRVGFLSLNLLDDPDTVRDLVRERGWTMPVGYDRDGAVAALYGVGGCPTFAFAYPGGTLESANAGHLSSAEIERRVESLLRATARAEAG